MSDIVLLPSGEADSDQKGGARLTAMIYAAVQQLRCNATSIREQAFCASHKSCLLCDPTGAIPQQINGVLAFNPRLIATRWATFLRMASEIKPPNQPERSVVRDATRMLVLSFVVGILSAGSKDHLAEQLSMTEQAREGTLASHRTSALIAREAAAREAAMAAKRGQVWDHLRALERRIADAAMKLEYAGDAQKSAVDEVASRSKDLGGLLPVALRLSVFPAETLLAEAGPPERAVEGLLAMRGIAAELGRQAAALKADQQKLRALTGWVTRQRSAFSAEDAIEAKEAAVLDKQINQVDQDRVRAVGEAAVATRVAAALAAKAEDLRGAIAIIGRAERRTDENAARAKSAKSGEGHRRSALVPARQAALSPPEGPAFGPAAPHVQVVAGRITRKFGGVAEDGPATGITYATASGSFVVSPCAGRVAFAAPFRGYGKLMIIECGQGYDFVLAGMERVDAKIGRAVRPGERVGRMRQLSAQVQNTPLLYVELRKNGEPIDPKTYLDGKP